MDVGYIIGIYLCVLLALVWSIIHTCSILKIKVESDENDTYYNKNTDTEKEDMTHNQKLTMVRSIGEKIQKGAYAFLGQEYLVMLVFVGIFSVIVILVVDVFGIKKEGVKFRMYAVMAFIIGSLTSMVCGWIGMAIAVKSNFRTTFMAT